MVGVHVLPLAHGPVFVSAAEPVIGPVLTSQGVCTGGAGGTVIHSPRHGTPGVEDTVGVHTSSGDVAVPVAEGHVDVASPTMQGRPGGRGVVAGAVVVVKAGVVCINDDDTVDVHGAGVGAEKHSPPQRWLRWCGWGWEEHGSVGVHVRGLGHWCGRDIMHGIVHCGGGGDEEEEAVTMVVMADRKKRMLVLCILAD